MGCCDMHDQQCCPSGYEISAFSMAPAQERPASHRLIWLDTLFEGHCCDILPEVAKLSQHLDLLFHPV